MSSSLSGGPAGKAGGNYEALWGVRAMIAILLGEADNMRIEQPRVDGAEFYVESSGVRTHWQVKRQIIGQTWTLNALHKEGILGFFLECFRSGHRCAFASTTEAQELRILIERAKGAVLGHGEFLAVFVADKTWGPHFQ